MKVLVVEFACEGQDDQQVSRPRLRGPGLLRPYPRPAGEGRLGRSGGRFQDDLGGREPQRQAGLGDRAGGQGCREADPRHRPGPRGRGDFLARPRSPEREARAEGHAGRARHLQRHHQGRGAERDAQAARRSIRRSSTPTSPAAPSTISSASRSRRCSGASCRARVRPGACNPLRCASSAIASSRSRPSRRRNTGRSSRLSRQKPAASSTRASSARTARRSRASTSARGEEAEAFKRDLELATFHGRERRDRSRRSATRRRPSRPRPCSRRPRASSASRRRRRCASPSASTKASTSAARPSASSPTCARTASTWRQRRCRPRAASSARNTATATSRAAPRQLHDEGEERPGGARSDPPDGYRPSALTGRAISRSGAGAALRADLDPHDREPDGIGRTRAHQSPTSRRRSGRAGSTCAPPARS